MNHISKTLLLLSCSIAAISFSGCKKASTTPASIQGTWGLNSLMQVVNYNGVIVQNDTLTYSAGQSVTTFEPNGYFVRLTATGFSGGIYTVSGNVVTAIDTPGSLLYRYTILALTEQSLVIQRIDTTITGTNISIAKITDSYTR